jgi:hypothetical protein
MALISLSDWLDRFGDTAPGSTSPAALDLLRFSATEAGPARAANEHSASSRRSVSERLQQAWRRAFWRLKGQPSGST